MLETYGDHRVYTFGDFVLDLDRGALFRADKEVSLRPKSFDVLHYLVDRQGTLVSRDELHDAIWGNTVVTDDAVTQCLIDIRKALSDSSQSIIRTVPRRGYVFEMPVVRPADSVSDLEPATRPSRVLTWTAGLGVIAVLGFLAVWFAATSNRPPAPGTAATVEVVSVPSIAVLPFVVLSDDDTQTYFADGVSEEILNLLARQRGLKVIARTSSFSFRGRNVDIAAVAEQLGVSHVLEGSFRNDGNLIRINVQLIDTATGEFLWTESFDRTLSASNVFDIQSEIATTVSESLRAELPTLEYSQLTRIPTDNLDALDAYFEGRWKMETRDPAQLTEAAELFETAVRLDPEFALAHVALADVSVLRSAWGSQPVSIGLQRVETSVEAALTIDDQLGEAYLPLGNLLWWGRGDFLGAERAYRKGIELSPNYAPLYNWYAEMLAYGLGRPDDALAYAKMSVALDPRSAIIVRDYARLLAEAGMLGQAFEQIDLAIAIDPDLALGYLTKASLLHVYKGEIAEAIPLAEQAYRINPQSRSAIEVLTRVLIDLGYFDQAEALIDDVLSLAPGHGGAHSLHAVMQTLRGDRVGAVEDAHIILDDAPGAPWALAILRDNFMRERKHEHALELYERYHAPLLVESRQTVDLLGWLYPAAIDLSALLIDMGRAELASKLLAAALDEAERRRQQGFGPPNIDLVRIRALLGETDAAMDALRLAVDDGWRAGWRLALYHDRALESLRELPEFQDVVTRIEADIERQRRQLEVRPGPFRAVEP